MKALLGIVMVALVMVLVTYVFGFVFMFVVRRINLYIQRNFGRKGYIAFACIGTPFHEISHFVMAKLFGHKVTEIVLFQPREAYNGGVPGYIRHTYNPNSLYQKAGNLFIGIAPMLFGALAIFLPIRFFYPEAFISVMGEIAQGAEVQEIAVKSFQALGTLLHPAHLREWQFYVILLVMIFIGTHMSMSEVDMDGSWFGILSLLQLTAIAAFVVSLLPDVTMQMIFLEMVGILLHYVYLLSVVLVMDIAMALFFILLAGVRGK